MYSTCTKVHDKFYATNCGKKQHQLAFHTGQPLTLASDLQVILTVEPCYIRIIFNRKS